MVMQGSLINVLQHDCCLEQRVAKLIQGIEARSTVKLLLAKSAQSIRVTSAQSGKHNVEVMKGDRFCMGAV